ncbi:MAG: ABC-2 family transporter protein [Patescibacteria group bacterium]
MKKYWLIFKLTIVEYFIYRLNFLLWRFRSLIFFLSLFFFWLAVYGQKESFLGYQKAQMLTYIVGIAFLRGLILSSRSTDLEADIYTGKLSSYLLRPQKIFKYYFVRDLADKALNIFFVVLEVALVLRIFHFPFYFPASLLTVIWFVGLSLLAMVLFFILNVIASSLAFWTGSVWAPRWLIMIVFMEFMSGAFFPIDVLPSWASRLISLTPFPYLIYYPVKVWLEQTTILQNYQILFILFLWIAILFLLFKVMWKRGLKIYSAHGG